MVMDYTATTSTLLGIVPTKPQRYERPINGHNVTYHITRNPNDGTTTIVAKLHDDCREDVLNMLEDTHGVVIVPFKNHKFDKCCMSKHPTARAVCDPRDEYDEEYGKMLAYKRLEVTYWSQYENRIGKCNELLMKMFDVNSDLMTKISEKHLQRED